MKLIIILSTIYIFSARYTVDMITHGAPTFQDTAPILKKPIKVEQLIGKWGKHFVGEDANKDLFLAASEFIPRPEPGAYDSIDINQDGQCRVYGMNMEFKGRAVVKFANERNKLYIYPSDMPSGLSQDKQDQYALKFQIIRFGNDGLLVIPPVFESILIWYQRK